MAIALHLLGDLHRRVCEWVGVALVAAILLAVAAQVVFRYGLDSPLYWPEELCRAALIWMAFGLVGYAHQSGELVAYDALPTALLSPRQVAVLDALLAWVLCLALLLLAWLGLEYADFNRPQSLPTSGVSIYWAYISLPIGCTTLAISLAATATLRLIELRKCIEA